jgi:hypothetical protein
MEPGANLFLREVAVSGSSPVGNRLQEDPTLTLPKTSGRGPDGGGLIACMEPGAHLLLGTRLSASRGPHPNPPQDIGEGTGGAVKRTANHHERKHPRLN